MPREGGQVLSNHFFLFKVDPNCDGICYMGEGGQKWSIFVLHKLLTAPNFQARIYPFSAFPGKVITVSWFKGMLNGANQTGIICELGPQTIQRHKKFANLCIE